MILILTQVIFLIQVSNYEFVISTNQSQGKDHIATVLRMSNCILYSFLIGPKCFWVKINITSLLCLFLTKTSSGLHCAFKHYKQGLGWTYVTEVSICILFSSLLGLKRFSLFNMIMHSVVDRYSSRTTDRRREQQNRVPLFR